MSDVLDYVREKEPAFKQVDDDTLTEYIADRQPDFLKQDKTFSADYQRIVSTKAGGSLRGVMAGEGPPTPKPIEIKEPESAIPPGTFPPSPLEGLTPEELQKHEEESGKSLLPLGDWLIKPPGTGRTQVEEGINASLRENLNALGTPTNLSLLATGMGIAKLGPLAARTVASAFAVMMGKQVPQIASELGAEFGKPEGQRDKSKIAKLIGDATIATGFTVGAALPAAKGVAEFTGAEPSALVWKAQQIKPVAPATGVALEDVARTIEAKELPSVELPKPKAVKPTTEKGAEDAIQKRSAKTLSVDARTGGSQKVEPQVRGAETPALPQEPKPSPEQAPPKDVTPTVTETTPPVPLKSDIALRPAILINGNKYVGRTHSEAIGEARKAGENVPDDNEHMRGYLTREGEFVDRGAGAAIHEKETGQKITREEGLHSEDRIAAGLLPKDMPVGKVAAPEAKAEVPQEPKTITGRETKLSRIKELQTQIDDLAKKGGLTAPEASRFRTLNAEANSLRYEIAKPITLEDIASPEARKSTLPSDVVLSARNDLVRNKDIYDPIIDSAVGVSHNADTAVDDIMLGRNSKVSASQLYDAFDSTREAMRKHYGDTITLFRAEGKQRQKPTQNWATTREYARQFGQRIISKEVPIDNIIAVNVGLRGKYHEVIVGDKPVSTKPLPEPTPPAEGGKEVPETAPQPGVAAKEPLTWEKTPSVRSGGKQYFWTAKTDQGVVRAVWNRATKKWSAQDATHETIGEFDTPEQAKKAVEESLTKPPPAPPTPEPAAKPATETFESMVADAKTSEDIERARGIIESSKVEQEVKAVARTEGQRSAKEVKAELVSRLEKAIEDSKRDYPEKPVWVEIDIPGDGYFKVGNTPDQLTTLLESAKRIDTRSEIPVRRPTAKASLSGTDVEKATKLYGSPETAYKTVKRQMEALEDPEARAKAQELLDSLYPTTEAGKLTAQAETAQDTASMRRFDMGTTQRELDRLLALKRRNKGHEASIDYLAKKIASLKERAEFFQRSSDTFSAQAKEAMSRLEEPPPTPPVEPPKEPPAPGVVGEMGSAIPPATTGGELQLTIIPGAKEFIEKDVIPKTIEGAKQLIETVKGAQGLLAPPSLGPTARLAAGIVREHGAELARKDVQARKDFAKARSQMASWSPQQSLQFIDRVETGRTANLTPELQPVAAALRKAFNDRVRDVRALGTGKLQHVIQDYFPHIWKDPNAASSMIARIFGKRPLLGPKSFLKRRTIPLTSDGIAAGLEPVTWNPIDLTLLKLHEMDRYVMGQKILQEFKDKGLVKFSRSDIPEEGYAKINDSVGNVIEYRPTFKADGTPGAPERILHGHWFAQEDAARILNNFLSPGLARFAWYRALRWFGNNLNMATLGLSGYHATFTMIDSGTSKLSLGLEQIAQGKPVGVVTGTRGLLGTVAVNQLEAFYKGNKVLKEYSKPGSIGGDYTKIVDALMAGGGRVEMPQIFQNSTLRNFFDAVKSGNYPGALLRTPFAAIHAAAYPLMNVVVPRLKLGVFSDMALHELNRMGPNTTRDQLRTTMGKVWDSVDNRMGELVYDNLFWNRTVKDLSFLAVRSVGWNLGTLRELGGGMLDSTTMIKRLRNGEPAVTRRMAYLVALPMTVGLMGALYQKIRTGKGPEELKDYFYPKTGNDLPSGEPERVNFPSYLKDVVSVTRHPMQTVIHKLHPTWGVLAAMFQNKDYYGTEIMHPDDPLMQKVLDEAQFMAKAFIPYSAAGAVKREEVEPGIEPAVESFFGIMPLPAELTRTPAENLAIELLRAQMPQGARTKEQFDRTQAERKAIGRIKMGKMDIEEAVEKGLVDEKRAEIVQKRVELPYLQYAVSRLNATAAVKVFETSTPKERELISDLVASKIDRAKSLTDEERELLADRFFKIEQKK